MRLSVLVPLAMSMTLSNYSSTAFSEIKTVENFTDQADQNKIISEYRAAIANDPRMPENPYKEGLFLETTQSYAAFNIGLATNLGGSLVDVKFNVVFQSALTLAKHDPDGLTTLTSYDHNNQTTYLNYEPDTTFAGSCIYEASLETTQSALRSLSLFGTGFESLQSLSQLTKISSHTEIFNIQPGDSVASLLQECRERYREAIVEDLKNIARGMTYHVDKSLCQVIDTPQDQSLDNGKASDKSCAQVAAKSTFIQRCINDPQLGSKDLGYCRARNDAGSPCPLYQHANKIIAESPIDDTARLVTLGSPQEKACDRAQGLVCVMTQEGGWFRNWWAPYQPYVGECQAL